MEKQKVKSLVLLSGGLDSRLAVKLMEKQLGKKNVEAFLAVLPFSGGCCSDKYCVFRFCQKQGIKLNILDCTKGKNFKEYLKIIKNPNHKTGKALNPCIDCHIFILKKANQLVKRLEKKEKGKYIIVTGEVLGERPLSQHKKALKIVEKQSGLENKILRPLSALKLDKTDYEKKGVINRNNLLGIQGRQRKKQIKLAKEFNIDFPHPAGGCLLCEKGYCKKLSKILKKPNLTYRDIQLLSIGRHFYNSEIILGRDEKENKILEKGKRKNNLLIIPQQPGPTALIKSKQHISKAKKLIQEHSKRKIKDFKIN